MATASEQMHETAEAAAQKLAEAAAAAAAAAAAGAGDGLGTAEDGEEGEGLLGEAAGGNGDEWCFSTRAMVAVVVIIVCLVAAKVFRSEAPEDKRQRLRNERRAKKKATQEGPDEIDQLLSSIVRRQPGQTLPPGAVPISGRGVPRGMPPGGAGRGAGPGGSAAARAAAAAMAGAGRGRGNGAGRGGGGAPPPGAADNRPKLRWEQTNEEVEIVIRVDPKVNRSDVKVEVTSTMLKLSLKSQPVIAGHLFKSVDPEGCTWQIDNPQPGYPKEVTITLLKLEPSKSREHWWRAPLKGLENRGAARQPAQPADPEMVRKAIEAIKAKAAAGGAGASPGVKLGAKTMAAAAAGQQIAQAAPRSPGGSSNGAAAAPSGTVASVPGSPAAASSASASVGGVGAGGVDGAAAAAAGGAPSVGQGATATPPSKASKGGKKKNRKKK